MKYFFFLFFIDTHLLKIFFTAYSLKFNDTHLLKFFFTAYSLKFNDSLKGSNRSLPSFLSFSVVFHRTTEMLSKTNFFGILWTLWTLSKVHRFPSYFVVLHRTIKIETIMKYFFLFFIDTHLLKIFFTAYSLKFNDTHLLKFFSTAYSLKPMIHNS